LFVTETSVMPSLKYCCPGSPLRFLKGRTATEGFDVLTLDAGVHWWPSKTALGAFLGHWRGYSKEYGCGKFIRGLSGSL
jgi:hypothetical protein